MHFKDSSWSHDYATGIRSLLTELDCRLKETQADLDQFVGYSKLFQLKLPVPSKIEHRGPGLRRIQSYQHSQWTQSAESSAKVSSQIDADVVLRLTDFIEDYRNFITSATTAIEARLKDHNRAQANEETKEDDSFHFPLMIGTTRLETVSNLSDLLHEMIEGIRTNRRMIPLPGVNNDYFSSESFVKWVKQNLAENSMLKVESFGQNLLDHGLIRNWNKIGSHAKYCDGYYEFTDLARYTAKFVEQAPQRPVDMRDDKLGLELLIMGIANKAEVYERDRVELLVKVQKTVSEIMVRYHQSQLTLWNEQSKVANPVEDELMDVMKRSSGGWYWPRGSRSDFCDDILNQPVDHSDDDMRTKSVPLLFKHMLNDIVDAEWAKPFDLTKAHDVKHGLLRLADHSDLSDSSIDVNFLKLWLLELPDGLIPFTCYDSLVRYYKEPGRDSVVAIVGSIPRQNLSTLLMLMDQVSKIPLDELSKHEPFPFHHLILRPPPKTVYANMDDSTALLQLITDLCDESVRDGLYQKLEAMEKFNRERTQRQEQLSIRKQVIAPVKKSSPQASPSLRIFKTLSPGSPHSHKRTPSSSLDLAKLSITGDTKPDQDEQNEDHSENSDSSSTS